MSMVRHRSISLIWDLAPWESLPKFGHNSGLDLVSEGGLGLCASRHLRVRGPGALNPRNADMCCFLTGAGMQVGTSIRLPVRR